MTWEGKNENNKYCWQQAKRPGLHSDLLHAYMGEPFEALDSLQNGPAACLRSAQLSWFTSNDWTPRGKLLLVLNSKFAAIVADVSDPMTSFHSNFFCLLFAVCVDYDVTAVSEPPFLYGV